MTEWLLPEKWLRHWYAEVAAKGFGSGRSEFKF